MVVSEKGLVKAMKDAYKEDGYKVAAEDKDYIENVIIATPLWTVVIQKSELPRKVLGLIAEHLGEIPMPGTAYQVQKKQTQTEIFSMVAGAVMDFHSGEKEKRIVRRTNLTVGGYPIWQAADKKCVEVSPDLEEIMSGVTVRLIGEDLLMLDDDVSRVYVRCYRPKEEKELERLQHLAKIQW